MSAARLDELGCYLLHLQLYGDLMVTTNRWDPAVLERFRTDAVVRPSARRSTRSRRPTSSSTWPA